MSKSRLGRTLHFMSLIFRSTASEAKLASSRELLRSIEGGIYAGSHPTYEFSSIFEFDKSKVTAKLFLKSIFPTKL
jgi:hypothetical protein